MSRRRTFEFGGRIVSVVPAQQVRRVRTFEEAAEITRSAERTGGAPLLFEILGPWGPTHRVRRSELRRLVVKELLHHSLVYRRPFQEAVVYRLPEPVDLRDLVEPALLGEDTTEPPVPGYAEPAPWVEVEVVDTHGRPVSHLRGILRSGGEERRFLLEDGATRHEDLRSAAPVRLTLEADPDL